MTKTTSEIAWEKFESLKKEYNRQNNEFLRRFPNTAVGKEIRGKITRLESLLRTAKKRYRTARIEEKPLPLMTLRGDMDEAYRQYCSFFEKEREAEEN